MKNSTASADGDADGTNGGKTVPPSLPIFSHDDVDGPQSPPL